MRGTILHYDPVAGLGHISGDDNNRYTFTRADINPASNPAPGMFVDFVATNGVATEIFAVPGGNPAVATAATAAPGLGAAAAAAPVERGEPPLSLWGYFIRAVTSRYFKFSGRARRREFWGFVLFSCIFTLLLSVVFFVGLADSDLNGLQRLLMRGSTDPDAYVRVISPLTGWGILILAVFGLFLLIPSMAITVRRFHDAGLSGWFYVLAVIVSGIFGNPQMQGTLLGLLATVASLAVLVVCVLRSKPANKWGPDPTS